MNSKEDALIRIFIYSSLEIFLCVVTFTKGLVWFASDEHVYNGDITWGITLQFYSMMFYLLAILIAVAGTILSYKSFALCLIVATLLYALILITPFGEYPFRTVLLMAASMTGILIPGSILCYLKKAFPNKFSKR